MDNEELIIYQICFHPSNRAPIFIDDNKIDLSTDVIQKVSEVANIDLLIQDAIWYNSK